LEGELIIGCSLKFSDEKGKSQKQIKVEFLFVLATSEINFSSARARRKFCEAGKRLKRAALAITSIVGI
jgi:hypothetical protein